MGKRTSQLTQLTAAQVAQGDFLPIVDVSAGQTKYVTVKDLTGLPDTGWLATGESWAYSSWSATTRIGVITVPTDATTKYTPKNRIRFSQTTGGTKYGIIVAVTATTLTVFFPVGTTFNNETITSPVYSPLDSPLGFNTDKTQWMLELIDTSLRQQASAVVLTYYNVGSLSLVLGVGLWELGYLVGVQNNAGGGIATMLVALSDANNNANYSDLRASVELSLASSNINSYGAHVSANTVKKLTSQTTVYLNLAINSGGISSTIYYRGDKAPTRIYAYCAYL